MARQTRLKYTEEIKSYIWDRHQQGDAIRAIGRAIDRTSSSIHGQLALTGGIRPPSRWREETGVTRNDLSQSVYPSARGL